MTETRCICPKVAAYVEQYAGNIAAATMCSRAERASPDHQRGRKNTGYAGLPKRYTELIEQHCDQDLNGPRELDPVLKPLEKPGSLATTKCCYPMGRCRHPMGLPTHRGSGPPAPSDQIKAPNRCGRHDQTTRLITACPCGTTTTTNRLGHISITREKRGHPPTISLNLGHLATQAAHRRELLRVGLLVQSPLPGLAQGCFRLRSSPMANPPHRAHQRTTGAVGRPRIRRIGRGPEQLPPTRDDRNASRQARHHCSQRRRGRHHRRQDRAGEPFPHHPSNDLPICRPQAIDRHQGLKITGQVAYPDHAVDIPKDVVDAAFVRAFGSLIRRFSSQSPAKPVPSPRECGFCDITAADCPERVSNDFHPQQGSTADF